MNKLKLWLMILAIIIFTFVSAKLVDENQNNFQIINKSFQSPKILKQTEIRPRRWTDAKSVVHVSIENWILKTQLNNHLIVSSNFTISWIAHNESIIPTVASQENCQVLQGYIEDNENSLVIMTICGDNFYVFFQLDNRSFAVHPTNNGSHILKETKLEMINESPANQSRKIIKRDSIYYSMKKLYNLTGDTFNLDEDILGPTNVERQPDKQGEDYANGPNYFSDGMWIKSENSSE